MRAIPRKRKKQSRTEKGLGSLKFQGKGWYLTLKLNGKVYNHATGKTDLEEAKQERDRFIRSLKQAEIEAAVAYGTDADSRKYPSPQLPKPEPGVPTTWHSARSLSKNCQDVRPAGTLSQM